VLQGRPVRREANPLLSSPRGYSGRTRSETREARKAGPPAAIDAVVKARVALVAICETRAVPGRDLPLCSRGYVEAPFVALLSDSSQGADNRGSRSMSSGDEAARLAQAAWTVEQAQGNEEVA